VKGRSGKSAPARESAGAINSEEEVMAERGRVKNIVVWVVSVLLALMFLMAGGGKLMNPSGAGQMFTQYGYPAWFAVVIGVVEVVGAVLLLVPRTALYAAGALAVTMAGAVFTHLKTPGEVPRAVVPFVLLALLVLGGLARWRKPEVRREAAA
jgi:putative oxidoreductase